MELEKQVVSLELAKRLKELGVKQESYFYWEDEHTIAHYIDRVNPRAIAAFNVAELGEMLGIELTDANESDSFTLKCGNAIDFWWATFGNDEADIVPQFENANFADALAELLIHLIENKLITV